MKKDKIFKILVYVALACIGIYLGKCFLQAINMYSGNFSDLLEYGFGIFITEWYDQYYFILGCIYLLVYGLFKLSRLKNGPKTIFYISLLPYLGVLIYSCISFFTGFNDGLILPHYTYGFEAFVNCLLWCGLVLVLIPVLPVCLIIQLWYLVFVLRRKKQ